MNKALSLTPVLRFIGVGASGLLAVSALRLPWERADLGDSKLAGISVAMEMVMVLLAASSVAMFVMSLANRAAAIGAAIMGLAVLAAVVVVLHMDSAAASAFRLSGQGPGVLLSLIAGLLIVLTGATLTLILYGARRPAPRQLR